MFVFFNLCLCDRAALLHHEEMDKVVHLVILCLECWFIK
jgi:hypothetical protein